MNETLMGILIGIAFSSLIYVIIIDDVKGDRLLNYKIAYEQGKFDERMSTLNQEGRS